jgi:uncharacterized protein (DUF983 family)
MSADRQIALAILLALGTASLLAAMGVAVMVGMAWGDRAADASQPVPAAGIVVRRALARRCPACGAGPLFASYLKMNSSCGACGRTFWSNEGEWIGPLVIDYSATAVGALVAWTVLVFAGAPALLQIAIPVVVALGGGLAVLPWSRSFWTAFLYLNGEMRSDA